MRRTEDTGSALCLQRVMHKAGDELGGARKQQAEIGRRVQISGDRARTEEWRPCCWASIRRYSENRYLQSASLLLWRV